MNKYAIFEWQYDKVVERILFKYKSTKYNKNKDRKALISIELIHPKTFKLIKIEGDGWKWFNEGDDYDYYPLYTNNSPLIFEAPDDESAKLMFELGEYK